jgi:hypothetical protein
MTLLYQKLRGQVELLKQQLASAEKMLSCEIKACNHTWNSSQADHIRTPAYQIPGDPPGTMGIDWRGPTYVNAKIDKRWKRTCVICGTVQYTNHVKKEVTEHPDFD